MIRKAVRTTGYAMIIPPAVVAATMIATGLFIGGAALLTKEGLEYATSTPEERRRWHRRGG